MTWTPIDLAAADERNYWALLGVAAAGRRIYQVEQDGERFYRFDELASDFDDGTPDGSMWVDEAMWLLRDGLLARDGDGDAVITEQGRRAWKERQR